MSYAQCSAPPPTYGDSERQRLLAGSTSHGIYSPPNKRQDPQPSGCSSSSTGPPADGSYTSSSRPIWLIILLLLIAGSVGFYSGRPSDAERTSIRARWDLERRNHASEVEKWDKDRNDRRTQETEEIARFKKEEEVLLDRKQALIADFNHTEHELVAKEQALREKIARFEEEWQRRVDEENRKRERARLYWDDIQGDEHCLSNGRKRYTARLVNLTPSLDAMEACKFTPITFNGVTYDHPIACENKGSHGVRGHWVVDNEGVCAAYWEFVKTKDCTAPGSGYRRIEAKLGIVHAGENPEILCLTTPLYTNGKTYSRPLACPNWGTHGYWGIWNVPDEQCK